MKCLMTAVAGVAVVLMMTGCAHTNDGRTGLRGEICAFGYCLAPQAMAAESVPVNETAIVSGPAVAPATVVSQPVVATQERVVTQYVPTAVAPPPAQVYSQQLAK